MPALDAIAGLRTTGGGGSDTAYNAVTVAPGDSATIRSFSPQDYCELLGFCLSAGAAPLGVRIRSPLMHDAVEGIQVIPGAIVSTRLVPAQFRQRFRSQDTLTYEIKGSGTSDDNVAAVLLYYSNILGLSARLHTMADIANLIKSIKVVQVTAGSAGAAGQWYDQALNLTEDLLHANTDYAVLGYVVDTACTALAVKGADTGNLRCAGPGVTDGNITAQWFVRLSQDTGLPTIPVINSANKASAYVSFLHDEAPTGINGQVILAELAQNLVS